MKDIQATMSPEDLAEYRRLEAAVRVVEGGCVSMTFEEAVGHITRHREFWTWAHEKYQLDPDEYHAFDAVTGTISVAEPE